MSDQLPPARHYFELRTICPMGDCPVTVHGEPHSDEMRIVDCSRWREGHQCRAECAHQVSLEYAIELARRVQEMLEPPPVVRLEQVTATSWMAVSQRVGGDFQSAHCLGRRLLAVQGDVMGKGVNAALLAAFLVGMFEALIPHQLPLPEMLARVNRAVAERTRNRPLFATALAVELDLVNRQWTFSRAGHELPLLMRRVGHRSRLVSDGGLPLGVDPQERYRSYRRPLQEGDRLLMYTDGLLEVGLTRRRLEQLLSAPNTNLKDLVALLPASPPYQDDVSLLLLTHEPPV